MLAVNDAVRLAALRVKLRQQNPAADYSGRPTAFFREVLGAEPYDRQMEMLKAVREHPRVAVNGAQATGKDWCAGRIILWWLSSFHPAKVIILGPTHAQVAKIVWLEARKAYYSSKVPLGGKMLETPYWRLDDESFALGISTDNPYNLQGWHSPHLLLLITEAHNMRQDDIEAGKRLNPEKILMTGNPLTLMGEFYDAFHTRQDLWHTIKISAFDSPNVKQGRDIVPGLANQAFIDARGADWGEDSVLYKTGVLGEFPESLEDSLIQRAWVDRALTSALEPGEPHILGVDVAAGGDKTVMFRRDGLVAKIVWKGHTPDVMGLVGRVKMYLDEHAEFDMRVTVDQTGIGVGICHRLKELGVKVNEFIAGEAARDTRRFANAQAEAWGLMADAFREGRVKIENDPALIAQLCTRRYEIQSDRRIKLESKADLKAAGGRSPDEADALALTFSPMAARRIKLWV